MIFIEMVPPPLKSGKPGLMWQLIADKNGTWVPAYNTITRANKLTWYETTITTMLCLREENPKKIDAWGCWCWCISTLPGSIYIRHWEAVHALVALITVLISIAWAEVQTTTFLMLINKFYLPKIKINPIDLVYEGFRKAMIVSYKNVYYVCWCQW